MEKDFQRLLLVEDVLTGYALFEHDNGVRYLLHPKDDSTSVKFSSLAMIHAVLEDLFTPEQARAHVTLIRQHLLAPIGRARVWHRILAPLGPEVGQGYGDSIAAWLEIQRGIASGEIMLGGA